MEEKHTISCINQYKCINQSKSLTKFLNILDGMTENFTHTPLLNAFLRKKATTKKDKENKRNESIKI